MSHRINAYALGNKAVNALHALGQVVNRSSVEESLLELVYYRVSQLNGCAFCLDMHAKNLRAKGETEQRLYVVSAWREGPFYSEREKAALAWADSLTHLRGQAVAEEVYQAAAQHFSETELVDLTVAITVINSYNRLNLAFGAEVGAYRVQGQAA